MRNRYPIAALLLIALARIPGGAQDTRVAELKQAAAGIQRNDLAGAARILTDLLEQKPEDAVALNLLGVVRMREGQTEAAKKLFREAMAKGPGLPGPHINLALLFGPERPFDAIAELAAALERAPGDSQAQSALRAMAEQAALQAVNAGDKEKALAVMLQARRALPHDPELLYKFGLVAMEAGMFTDAQAALEEALHMRTGYPEATYALARAYLGESRAAEAEQQLRNYLAMRPGDASAQYGLGYVLASEQKLDEAQAAFERSLAARPEQTESSFQLGEIAMQKEDRGTAQAYFQKVLERDPRHAGALTETAVFAFRGGKYTEAAANLERAVSYSPGYQKAHYYFALALSKLGRKAEAEREFHIATDLQRKSDPIMRLAELPE